MATVLTTGFEVEGADGGPLRGVLRTQSAEDGRPVVVICHGFKGFMDWGMFPKIADRLAHAGFSTISFNFSGSGVGPDRESFSEPERFSRATFSNDLADLGNLCRHVKRGSLGEVALKPPKKLGLIGHSRGGGTAVNFAGSDGGVDALVTWAAISHVHRWDDATLQLWRRDGRIDIPNARTGEILPIYTDVLEDIDENATGTLDIPGAASKVTAPWLIVHGDRDETVGLNEARSLHELSGEKAKLAVVEGGNHTFGSRHPWAGPTREFDEALGETVGWFSRYLL